MPCIYLLKAQNGLRFAVSSARIFFGRGAVMAKALGSTPEEEHRLGLFKLATVRKQTLSFSIIGANSRISK